MSRLKMSVIFFALALSVLIVPKRVSYHLLKMCDDAANDPEWIEAKRPRPYGSAPSKPPANTPNMGLGGIEPTIPWPRSGEVSVKPSNS